MKKQLCKECQTFFDDICLQINTQAERMKRGNMILDSLHDVMRSVDDGNINAIVERDRAWKQGKAINRRLEVKK